jgi:hypothetical protein
MITRTMSTSPTTRSHLYSPLLLALRTYWPAILIIQAIALGSVVAYYRIDTAAGFFATMAGWKAHGGLLFAALANLVSGGVLPELLKRCFRPSTIAPPKPLELAHQFVMWAVLGIAVDVFYGLQSHLFGNGTDAVTLFVKVVVDQLVFTPLVALPFIVGWFALYEVRYRPRAWLAAMLTRNTVLHGLQLWITCLSFWPVMLLIIYSLPHELQFSLYLFGNAAYSILLIFIARRRVTGS